MIITCDSKTVTLCANSIGPFTRLFHRHPSPQSFNLSISRSIPNSQAICHYSRVLHIFNSGHFFLCAKWMKFEPWGGWYSQILLQQQFISACTYLPSQPMREPSSAFFLLHQSDIRDSLDPCLSLEASTSAMTVDDIDVWPHIHAAYLCSDAALAWSWVYHLHFTIGFCWAHQTL